MISSLTAAQTLVLSALVDAWTDDRLVLIGAAALGFHVPMTWRGTNDIDLVIATDITTARARLSAQGLVPHSKLEHRWISADGVNLDVLPVREEDVQRGRLTWPSSGFTMSLEGFDLVFRCAERHALDGGRHLYVASVATIALLKMAAWLDRPNERQRDLIDLGALLAEYLDDDGDRRWDDRRLRGTTHDEQGAVALGLDIAAIAQPHHLETVERFLKRLDESAHGLVSLASAGRYAGHDRESQARSTLAAFRRGLTP